MKTDANNINHFYDKAYDWIIDKGPSVILGVVILFLGLWLIKLLGKWVQGGMHRKDVNPSLRPFLTSLMLITLRILLVLTVMQIIGIQLTFLTVLIGGIGVAAGLALSGTLQNFASGVLILLLKPFVVGDNIIAQGQEGTVTSIQIFYTIVKTFDNRTVVIPNSKLSNEVIINISREGIRRLDIEIKFSYGIDYEKVVSIFNKTVDEFSPCLKTPERRIGVSALEDSGYRANINVWVNAHGFTDTKLSFLEVLMKNLKLGGIKLPGMPE
ncbi:mechanosensitive ion channel family protein [Pedobacter alluvionis]|uniref:Mechanosensitive ion channel family protein n=1 Tax=Pedobacter alluvionis TaxID=475253 RepID=A0A497XL62_9SPHI|nr:mechanosensitive ion channel family protein [Pedobacter alluvionis]RLJ69461.1 small conductance mechanosensitive channel [Pedobacter alluvionis]TFB28465.1 mechanosensitive ion channel family protein [Pedobacter alluvionis]